MSRSPMLLRFLLALLPGLVACPSPVEQQTINLGRPQDIVTVCVDNTKGKLDPVPPEACNLDTHTVLAFITNGELGDIAIVNPGNGAFVDNDAFTPGYTRLVIGGQPLRLVASASAEYLFTSNAGTDSLDRITVTGLSLDLERQPLPGTPSDVRLVTVSGAEVAYVTLPEQGRVARIPLETFGTVEAADVETIATGGTPRRLVVKSGETGEATAVYVSHTSVSHVTVIDPVTAAVSGQIPFAPACRDGLDNDGDGLTDGLDPDCTDPDGSTEEPEAGDGVPAPACNNGVDDDGDGLVDYPEDPGCVSVKDPTEHSAKPACSDGLDNDGDGLVDLLDPDCADHPEATSELPQCADGEDDDGDGKADSGGDGGVPDDPECLPFGSFTARQSNAESTYPTTCNDGIDNDGDGMIDAESISGLPVDTDCAGPWANAEARPRCSNGVDDDGDGLADDLDPDCYSRAFGSEAAPNATPVADLALTSDGAWLYVTDQARSTVEVIDTESGTWLDLNARDGDLGNPVLASRGIRGIPLTSPPLAIGFAPSQVTEGADQKATETAFISVTSGQLFLVDATVGDEPRHQLRGTIAAGTTSTATQPDLSIAGQSYQQGLSVQADFANLGPFSTKPSAGQYFGITFGGNPRIERTEVWRVVHEGVIYDRSRHSTSAVLSTDGTFHDPYADFCAAGVEPGDILVLDPGYRIDCAAPGSAAHWIGDRFEIPVAEVRGDTLILSPEGGKGIIEELVDVETPCGTEQREREFEPGATVTPHPTCFPAIAGYKVRAPEGMYTVSGSQSGFVHPWKNVLGQCVRASNDALLTGRAIQSEVATPELTSCKLPLPNDSVVDTPFANHSFSFKIRPACCATGKNTATLNPDTPRDLQWKFTVTSGFATTTPLGGTLPKTIRYSFLKDRLFVVDEGRGAIVSFAPKSLGEYPLLF